MLENPFRRMIMKMDVEGYEYEILTGAVRFFSVVDVHYILMEWQLHREDGHGQTIIDMLTQNNMDPLEPVRKRQ
jgi:hypothetical protein